LPARERVAEDPHRDVQLVHRVDMIIAEVFDEPRQQGQLPLVQPVRRRPRESAA
jgi:hypothetical protein